jgi:uroporphyrin-III C-methyltransferase/uroporphyrinogen III methyltransferase/synthase
MGGKNLPEIIHQLIKYKKSDSTPIAIIRWAGTPNQEIWIGELGNILAQTAGLSLSPAVIVVGEVVRLRNYL